MDERVFATLTRVQDHGGDQRWLYMSKCGVCGQNWMVAQEERIFDDYFMRRVTEVEAQGIAVGQWPDDFVTYERVLRAGQALSKPCVFLDPLAPSLVWTVEDLKKDRPEIAVEEIASLLGVTLGNAKRLLKAKAH